MQEYSTLHKVIYIDNREYELCFVKEIKQANPLPFPPPPHFLISISAAPEGEMGARSAGPKIVGGGGSGRPWPQSSWGGD